MIELPNLTLWAACWSGEEWMLSRTIRVVEYCLRFMKPARAVIFSGAPFERANIECHMISNVDQNCFDHQFINRLLPRLLPNTQFALCVHEDGFPIYWSLWDPQFLEFDYIGAPWGRGNYWGPASEGVVGNGGFFIESRKFMDACLVMPTLLSEAGIPGDVYACVKMRSHFEQLGCRFAPTPLALKFSTEQYGHAGLSFGFHGRRDQPAKYAKGWKQIEESER